MFFIKRELFLSPFGVILKKFLLILACFIFSRIVTLMSLKKLLIFGIIKEELKEEGVKDPLEELSKESCNFPKESINCEW